MIYYEANIIFTIEYTERLGVYTYFLLIKCKSRQNICLLFLRTLFHIILKIQKSEGK